MSVYTWVFVLPSTISYLPVFLPPNYLSKYFTSQLFLFFFLLCCFLTIRVSYVHWKKLGKSLRRIWKKLIILLPRIDNHYANVLWITFFQISSPSPHFLYSFSVSLSLLPHPFLFDCFLCGVRNWTWGFSHARQVPCHWAISTALLLVLKWF